MTPYGLRNLKMLVSSFRKLSLSLAKPVSSLTYKAAARNFNYTAVRLCQAKAAALESSKKEEAEDEAVSKAKPKPYSENHPGLMEFFDSPENWCEESVKTGRPWKIDELRIKSNSDLHKLWYVLLKERNMLLTMKENYERDSHIFPSPERIEKVEESMEKLEKVVRERNKAYWELEVGEGRTGERRSAFRKDQFGRYKWIMCSEHLVPYRLNSKWRMFWGPGHGKEVDKFIRKYIEQKRNQYVKSQLVKAYEVRQILRKFPDVDLDYLQEVYPNVPVQYMKENLHKYEDRFYISPGHLNRKWH